MLDNIFILNIEIDEMIFFLYIEYIIFILRTKKKKARKKERDKQMIEL